MVVYLKNKILLELLVVFIYLGASSSTEFNITFARDEVDKICSDTRNSSLCLKLLNSNPLTERSDVPGLEKFLVTYAQQNISDTLNQIQSILQNVTDLHTKKDYMTCSTYLKWAATYCENALKALVAKDYETFHEAVLDALNLASDCKNHLKMKIVKYDPQLILKIDVLYNVCDIALVLANKL